MNIKSYTDSPLVSIIVITYNSGKYVLETLESAKAQTYQNIELIISDDGSSDNTIEICQNFLEQNKGRFVNTLLITVEKNTGIPANCNRGLKASKGEWFKLIAGDDILMPNCISSFVDNAIISNDKFFTCGVIPFSSKKTLPKRVVTSEDFDGNSSFQIKTLIRKGTILEGPTFFLHRETLNILGGFDEKYPFVEDYPLAMKFLSNGYRIHLVNEYLIKYRECPESASRSNPKFTESIYRAMEDYAIPLSFSNKMYLYWYHYIIFFSTIKILKRSNSKWNRLIVYILKSTDVIGIKKKIFKP